MYTIKYMYYTRFNELALSDWKGSNESDRIENHFNFE